VNAEISTHFSATPRGARLARLCTAAQLATWGHPHDSEVSRAAQQVVAELAANAVTHGKVPGRDFRLCLRRTPEDTLRIEVSDARGDRQLRYSAHPDAEGGRGLVLVTLLSQAWGVTERTVGKTVWAELPLKEPSDDDAQSTRPRADSRS
jgi:anti-sigma regulatory factor (Ser/Thr protein kinase)